MPSPDRAWRRLLEAFSDAPAASGPRTEPVRTSPARRLLEAFSDTSPAFSPRFPPPTPGLEATVPGHAFARGAVVFGVLGAVCTAWVAAATGTLAAVVVAALTFSILALLIAPMVEFARARTASLRAREQVVRSAERADEHRESFWYALGSGERRHVRDAARPRTYGPGAPILRQGYPADYVVVILSGWTKIRVDRAGEERIVAVRGPGDLVGERALFDGDTWSATVIALDTVRVLKIEARDFRRIVARHPGIQSVLEKQAHDRAIEEGAPATSTELADTERRLAALFTTLSRARHGALPVTGRELAGWTSSSPAAVASVLNEWGGAGLVHAEGGTIDVLDPARLELLTVTGEPTPNPPPVSHFLDRDDCTVLFAEVVGFGSPDRTEADRIAIRRTLYRSLEESFDIAGVSWAACHHEDRGDGVLLVVPPGIPASAPADLLVPALAERIARYGGEAVEAQRFQVRVAVDTGPVLAAPDGVTGAALAQAARLLGADALRQRLASSSAVLGLIVSTAVHQLVSAQAFERVQADNADAWLRLYPSDGD